MAGLDSATDALLAERSAEGDVRAFEVLVKRHQSILRAYAWRLTGSQADASDAVQNALITVWAQLPQLREPASVRSWMMRIVSRSSVDLLRQRHPTDDVDAVEHPASREPGPFETAERSDAMRALARAEAAGVAAPVLAAARGGRGVVPRDRPASRPHGHGCAGQAGPRARVAGRGDGGLAMREQTR